MSWQCKNLVREANKVTDSLLNVYVSIKATSSDWEFVHTERRGLQSRSDIQDAKVLKVYAFVARQPVAAAAPPPKFCPGQLLPPRLARRVAACSLFVQQAVYIVFLCMCGATAAAAARQQPYTITPLCALLLKNQDTHITQYTLSYSYFSKCKTVYLLYVHICKDKGVPT